MVNLGPIRTKLGGVEKIAFAFIVAPKVSSVTPTAAGKPLALSWSQARNISLTAVASVVGMMLEIAQIYFCRYAGPEMIDVPLAELLKAADPE